MTGEENCATKLTGNRIKTFNNCGRLNFLISTMLQIFSGTFKKATKFSQMLKIIFQKCWIEIVKKF
jgi:hypothetical protein